MKKKITTTRVSVTFMLICILFLIACYYFDFVNQPFTAEPNSSFEVDISVTQSPGNGSDAIPYFGVVLPLGWTVNDSIVFSYGNSFGMLVYSDSLTQLMYTLSPVPLDYYWWVAEGLNELERDIGQTYLFSPVINPSDQPGTYYLDYMLGDNSNGLNYRMP